MVKGKLYIFAYMKYNKKYEKEEGGMIFEFEDFNIDQIKPNSWLLEGNPKKHITKAYARDYKEIFLRRIRKIIEKNER